MGLLLFFGLLIAIVWSLVLFKHFPSIDGQIYLFPILGYLVILAGAVFSSEFFSVGGPIPITIDRLILGGMVALFCLMILARKETIFVFNRVDISVLILTAVIFLSTITHDYTFLKNLPASRLLFFNLMPLALYFVMRNSRFNDANLKLVAGGLVGLGVYLSITAIFETRGLGGLVFPRYIMDPDYAEFLGRGRGPFLNPVSNGIFQVVGLTSLWMWWPNASYRRRVIILCLAVLMCIGIYSTFTRSVWLGLIFAAGLAVFRSLVVDRCRLWFFCRRLGEARAEWLSRLPWLELCCSPSLVKNYCLSNAIQMSPSLRWRTRQSCDRCS